MADGRGGYRAPSNPAPVSGVGKNSRRTDGGPVQALRRLPAAEGFAQPNAYGEDTSYYQEQRTAPLAAGPQASTPPPPQPAGGGQSQQAAAPPLPQVVPMGAPSQRPDEPVTAGADLGAGPGSAALGLANPTVGAITSARQFVEHAAATSSSPMLTWLAGQMGRAY